MAKWRKRESLAHVLGHEGGAIAKGLGKELLSIATLGVYRPKKHGQEITIKYPDGRVVKVRR